MILFSPTIFLFKNKNVRIDWRFGLFYILPILEETERGLLLPSYNFLDVVEFVEGFDGREVVDVETEDFVANLAEHGVVELEE